MQLAAKITLIALAVLATAPRAQILSTSHRKVNWGWGCGGHCAVNMSGESETTLGNDPPDVHLEDHGSLTRRQTDPGGTMTSLTTWRYAFHGTSTTGAARREFNLQTDISQCTRHAEIIASGNATVSKETTCPGPPKHWKLTCEQKDVQVKGKPRPAWVCSPPGPMDDFGTEFPWVFGIEKPITTIVSGEPQPHTTYE